MSRKRVYGQRFEYVNCYVTCNVAVMIFFFNSEGPAFEKIRGGARQVDDPSNQLVKLSIGNKFDALDADDS